MKLLKKGGIISFIIVAVFMFFLVSMGITEETALGSVAGTVKMSESGAPLIGAQIILTPLTPPTNDTDEHVKGRVTYADKSGNFSLLNVPSGAYKIEASAKVHDLKPTDILVKEGGVTNLDLELDPGDPTFNIYTSQRVFLPDETAQVEAHGFGSDNSVNVRVYKIDLSQFLAQGSIYGVLYSISNSPYQSGKHKNIDEVGKLVDSFQHPVQNVDAEGSFIDVIDLKKLSEGFYWVECKYGDLNSGAFVNISRIALVTKSSPGQVLSFVTDLKTGQPVPGATVAYNDNNQWVEYGKTDSNGLSNVKIAGKGRKLLMLATDGASQAVSAFFMYGTAGNDNSRRYEGDDGDSGGPPDANTTVFVYTDRPIYRPGDDVQFKGFARTRVGSQYNLPGPGKVTCEVRDTSDSLVKTFDVAMDANGAFHGHYQTGAEDEPGEYRMTFHALGRQEPLYFTLAAYRKPEFTIKVTWSKSRYTMGERLRATVKCEYYFGGPVAGAKVDAQLYRNQDWYDEESDPEDYDPSYSSDEGGVGGDFVDQSSGVTDANGEAVFEFDPKPEKLPDDYSFTPNYQYTLSANVTEAGDKYFSGQGSVKVSQGEVDLRVDPNDYIVTPGKNVDITVSTMKSDDQSPAPGHQVQIVYGTEAWSRRTDTYKFDEIFTAIGHAMVTTGADGTVHYSMPADHTGSYVIKASTVDSLGNTIRQQGYVYVGTDDFVPPPTAPDLSITLDKKIYMPGDTCKILIGASKPGLTALLTIEAETVLYTQVVHIQKQSQLVSIPVDKGYLPRVTVSVVAVQNKKFLETSEPLKVDVTARTLKLTVSSDRPQYLPGSTATYSIHAVGADGKPAAADLSLGVVDEAIYALLEDHTNPVRSFYPAREDRVGTNYSFPELYLDGGDKGGEVPVRMNFKDTAAWLPSIRTDTSGNATVQVKLPDNLTKWRATVIGVSDATDVGLAKYDVVVNKPLMIRLEGPKFMVNGDHQEIAAIVNNNSGADADVHVSLQATGLTTRNALNQEIRVGNGQSTSISWDLRADVSGPGRLIAKAWVDGGPNDGVQQDITIQSHAREVDFRNAGDIQKDGAKFRIIVRKDADPNVGRFKLTVSPTIGTSIYDALDQLIDYPYGCVEQTMSRFLPAMVARNSLKQIGILRPDLDAKVPAIAQQSLTKLKNMQHSDGGWGWWEFDSSHPFMTAYVLDGLLQAKAAGFKVSPYVTDNAVSWASKTILSKDAKDWTVRDRLYLAYVLAKYGKKDVAAKVLDKTSLKGQGAAQVATAALLANELGPNYADKRDELIQRVRDMATVDDNTAYWKPKIVKYDWWWEYDDVYGAEVSAVPLQALEAISPNDPLIIKGIRHLLLDRDGSWWWSTRDSSFALMAIAWYLKEEQAPTGASTVHVLVNGSEVTQLHMDVHNLPGLSPSYMVPVSQLRSGSNDIELKLDNANVAYYTVDFRQYAVAPTLGKPVNGSGYTIDRSYHLLSAQQMEDGTLKLKESSQAVTSIKSGDLIQCDLVINSDRDRDYVMITDPIPSNCHPETENAVDFSSDNPWEYWYANQDVYDDRLTFFATRMAAGRHVISYVLRSESPGIAHALPPVAGNMYKPDDNASDSEYQLEVTR